MSTNSALVITPENIKLLEWATGIVIAAAGLLWTMRKDWRAERRATKVEAAGDNAALEREREKENAARDLHIRWYMCRWPENVFRPDEIAEKCDVTPEQAAASLVRLAFIGAIKQVGDGYRCTVGKAKRWPGRW